MDALLDVAFLVAVDLSLPELAIALGQHEVLTAFVTVPKATIDKDDCLVFAQYYVGGTGQALDVYAVAVAVGVQVTSHNQFWFCVLALDARHALVPLFFCHPVCHAVKVKCQSFHKSLLPTTIIINKNIFVGIKCHIGNFYAFKIMYNQAFYLTN